MRKVYPLTPSLCECIWGGTRLKDYGKKVTEGGVFGESWELSFVPGSESRIDGTSISDCFGKEAWGAGSSGFEAFPVLTKFIDAKDKLSVQVHPSDDYALKNEGQYGKTEMWYVVDCDEGAGIYIGLSQKCTPEQFSSAVADGSVEELLNFKRVKPGDVYFIPSGTVHAIGAGVLIFEIQQNSTLTYRLYDYMRKDAQGKMRPLHVEKAMKVAVLDEYRETLPRGDDKTLIGKCEYFETHLYKLSEEEIKVGSDDSYVSVTCTTGAGVIDGIPFKRGDSFFIPAGVGEASVCGDCDVIVVSTPLLKTVEKN